MQNSDKSIRKFLDKITGALSRLEDAGLEQFEKRINSLRNNIESFSDHTIRTGLTGITSSGKSALLNVLLGTGSQILKEQSKATTNMIVFCSKSAEPELEINFESGKPVKKKGKNVLSESIWKYTAEDENPHNKQNVKYIRLSLPTFILDESVEIADTPGLDAYGLKEHEDLTLREFLPQADLVIYLSSIRSPMKEADRTILNRIMDSDQRILFVQTCMGSVVEKNYGDGHTESVERLIDRCREDFKKSLQPYSRLKDAPIVQVETSLAMGYFKDNDKKAWKESGFEEFLDAIKNIVKELQHKFTLLNLRRTVDEVSAINKLIDNTVRKESESGVSITEQAGYLKELKDCSEKIVRNRDNIVSSWSKKLAYSSMFEQYKSELSRIYSYKYDFNPIHDHEFIAKANELGIKARKLKDNFLDSIDSAKNRYRYYFKELGLDVRRKDIQNIGQSTFFFPNVQKKKGTQKLRTAKGSSGIPKLAFWKEKERSSEVTFEYVDKEKYYDDLRDSLKLFFEPLVKHLQWWNRTVTDSFVESLQKKISAIEDDMLKIEKGFTYDGTQHKNLTAVSNKMKAAVEDIMHLCDTSLLHSMEGTYSGYTKKAHRRKRTAKGRNLINQLYERLSENMFHSYYLGRLSEMSSAQKKSIVLIGQNQKSRTNFLRRLLRLDSSAAGLLQETETPYAINAQDCAPGISNISIESKLLNSLSFYVLNNDMESFNAAQECNLIEESDVIQIMIDDLHRVGSAAVDITERNLFIELMNRHRKKLLLTYPRATYFQKEKLHTMVNEAVDEINRIFHPDPVLWFIYENFEIRYSHFNDLALKMKKEGLGSGACVEEWKSRSLPVSEPFNENLLKEQFEELSYGR